MATDTRMRAFRILILTVLLTLAIPSFALLLQVTTHSRAVADGRPPSIGALERQLTAVREKTGTGEISAGVVADFMEIGRSARRIREAIDATCPGVEQPSDSSLRAFRLSTMAFGAALGSRGKAVAAAVSAGKPVSERDDEFMTVWHAAVNNILSYRGRWPTYAETHYSRRARTEVRTTLATLILQLCRLDVFGGDTWKPPRVYSDPRAALLPESLVACCLTNEDCITMWGDGQCAEFVDAEMAASGDVDALVGYRYNVRFWSTTPRARHGGEGRARIIASATAGALGELLGEYHGAFRDVAAGGWAMSDGSITPETALEIMRQRGGLWPRTLNPFETVPGLRNPRITASGEPTCDLIVYRDCFDAMTGLAREELVRRVGGEDQIVFVR